MILENIEILVESISETYNFNDQKNRVERDGKANLTELSQDDNIVLINY